MEELHKMQEHGEPEIPPAAEVRANLAQAIAEAGVTGFASLALMNVLAGCSAKPCCLVGVQIELEKWGMEVLHRLEVDGNDLTDSSVRSVTALLALLDVLKLDPIESPMDRAVPSDLSDRCGESCFRLLPNQEAWRQGVRQTLSRLLDAENGNRLFLLPTQIEQDGEIALVVALANRAHQPSSQSWAKLSKVVILPSSITAIDQEVAKRLAELCELALVRAVGPKVQPDKKRRTRRLEIPGLQIEGDASAWSGLYNALYYAIHHHGETRH